MTPMAKFKIRHVVSWFLVPVLISLIIISIIFGWGMISYGSPFAVMAKLAGDVFYIDQPIQSVILNPPEKKSVYFSLTNLTMKNVEILGAETSCGCAVVEGLPMEFGPGEKKLLKFTLTSSGKDPVGTIVQTARLYLSEPSPEVILTIFTRIGEFK